MINQPLKKLKKMDTIKEREMSVGSQPKPGCNVMLLAQVAHKGYFRTSVHSHIMMRTALKKESKIGAINPFGDLVWYPDDLKVLNV